MAISTSKDYRNQVLYSVYVRNYSDEGTFEGVRRDLGRIKALGVDIVWLMPIHPIGVTARKGSLGSPYAVADYRAVNPEFGTLDDFRRLVDGIHELGMRCIIDVVYNHTSPDSWLAKNHPEWFYRRADGRMGNRVGDWTDIVDLDYSKPELWDYQIETLKYWAAMVDGFRCDVAPLVPLAFWLRARREVEEVRPGCFWLAETVEPQFVRFGRADGLGVLSDAECLQAFDACYEYDSYSVFRDYLEGRATLGEYAAYLDRQEVIFPDNYVKLRFLENHDQLRAAFLIPDERERRSWTAFGFFQKGLAMLYAGQERGCAHLPGLFDRDRIDWGAGTDCSETLRRLGEMKKHPLMASGAYCVRALPGDILLAGYSGGGRQLVGIFSVKGRCAPVAVSAPDGVYRNLADGGSVEVRFGHVCCQGEPIVFEAADGQR